MRTQPLYLRKPDAVLPKLPELNYRAMNNFDLGAVLEIEKELFPDPWNLAQFKEELAGVPKTRTYFVVEVGTTQKLWVLPVFTARAVAQMLIFKRLA